MKYNNGLKPCPFCGGMAYFNRYVAYNDIKGEYHDNVRVRCSYCGACSQSIEYDAMIHGESGEYDEARELWNRRVENER